MRAWWPWRKNKPLSLFDPPYGYEPESRLHTFPTEKRACGQPHPKNAPGPFFVIYEECMSCGAPHVVAPDLLGWEDGSTGHCHCYFKRQPETPTEIELAIGAIKASCCGALVYSGDDALVCTSCAGRAVAMLSYDGVGFETAVS